MDFVVNNPRRNIESTARPDRLGTETRRRTCQLLWYVTESRAVQDRKRSASSVVRTTVPSC